MQSQLFTAKIRKKFICSNMVNMVMSSAKRQQLIEFKF